MGHTVGAGPEPQRPSGPERSQPQNRGFNEAATTGVHAGFDTFYVNNSK